jgi:hypothetical protein
MGSFNLTIPVDQQSAPTAPGEASLEKDLAEAKALLRSVLRLAEAYSPSLGGEMRQFLDRHQESSDARPDNSRAV